MGECIGGAGRGRHRDAVAEHEAIAARFGFVGPQVEDLAFPYVALGDESRALRVLRTAGRNEVEIDDALKRFRRDSR